MSDLRVLPAATGDLRGQAILDTVGKVIASADWKAGLALTLADIPTAMLPHAVRSLAVQNYVDPTMKEKYVRAVIDNALAIKVQEGTIKGVRFALSLLGMTVEWTQWHKMTPVGAPGTHKVVVRINELLFDGEPLLSERSQRHAAQVVETVKRHSQDLAFSIAADLTSDLSIGTMAAAPAQWAYFEAVAA
ncbi:MAG: phage tail protein I [Hyphomicrobiales bacterium]|nr:phage tail protein I [Hyphomicrobiales bacterium]